VSADPPPSSDDLVGSTIEERYRVTASIGSGASATVYLARDATLGRDVALKLFKHGLDERVRCEAGAMSRLAHPNVVNVFEVGTLGDKPYVAMEYVRGTTLRAWCTQNARHWREIVAMLVQTGEGLAAIHAAGLVHRKFNAENVLVGEDRRARVCDFVLADDPEAVDARIDQRAFCATALQCLAGTAAPARVRRVLERDHADLRALLTALGRATAPSKTWLAIPIAGVLVLAGVGVVYMRSTDASIVCPEPTIEAWDVSKRIRIGAKFYATGLPHVVSSWLRIERALDSFALHWRRHSRDACIAHRVNKTEDASLHARRTSCLEYDRIMFEAVLDRLVEPSDKRAPLRHGKLLTTMLPDLDACRHPDGFQFPADAALRARFAAFFGDVARIGSLAATGRISDATELMPGLHATANELGSKRAVGLAEYTAGQLALVGGRSAEAVKHFDAALVAAEAAGFHELVTSAASELLHALGAQARDAEIQWFSGIARAAAERVGSVQARARVARAIGQADLVAGRFAPAEHELLRALALEQSRIPIDDHELGATLTDVGTFYYRRGELGKAEAMQRRAIDVLARSDDPAHPDQGSALNNLANTLADLGNTKEARALYKKALDIRVAALGPDHPDVAQTLNNAAGIAAQDGDFEQARKDLERCLAIYDKTLPASHPASARVMFNLGEIARIQGDLDGALRHNLRALEIRQAARSAGHPEIIESQLGVADVYLERRNFTAAASACEDARASIARSDANNVEVLATAELCAGNVALESGQPARAVAPLERALAMLSERRGDPGVLAVVRFALARALPASASKRAIPLARAAREAFARDANVYASELKQADEWLAVHAP
jgi:tetratricopeptide (TPR) repeat protein/tRNA A-37 threonylcarbamoyl transferase component Bud32